MTRKWIMGAAVQIDEETAALLVRGLRAEKLDVAGVQANVTPGSSLALVTSDTMVTALWVMAKRAGAANSGDVYLKQDTAAANDLRGSHAIALRPGDYWEKPIPADTKYNLANLYLDADVATDGVIFEYTPAGPDPL